ncbi:MAG: peptidoglycan DD-metalloendopeptidase family protein [Oscillospiraceae bacterium]|nr:peptidoglycan DD-metalloendopeptidase family protein [Oscillospiraceae bacterium]
MNRTWLTRLAGLSLAGVLFFAAALPARAVSQSDIDRLQEKREALAARAAEQQSEIDALAEAQALYVVRKMALDQRIETNREEIEVITQQVALYDEMLREKENELMAAINAEETQSRQLRARMRAMEESGGLNYLSVLLDSHSLTDLLSRMADISDITQYDKELEERYRSARSDKESLRGEYQDMLAVQQGIQAELADKQSYLNSQVEAAAALLQRIDEDSDRAQEEYAAIQTAMDEADAEISALTARLAEERRAAAAAAAAAAASGGSSTAQTGGSSGGATASGSLSWPVPSSSLVTSEFGLRDQPTAGASTNHQGLDIGATAGSSIVAAGGGTVVAASSNSGYGNYVVIDHGNGTTTLYAHMQESAVSVGQYVSQEQVIGYVGSTGISTGPHCHFEVRVDGNRVDPESYYGGLSHWNG